MVAIVFLAAKLTLFPPAAPPNLSSSLSSSGLRAWSRFPARPRRPSVVAHATADRSNVCHWRHLFMACFTQDAVSSRAALRVLAGRGSQARTRSGFTLVELLVVIAIIGVLVSAFATGDSGGARSGPAEQLRQQSQAAWSRSAELSRRAEDAALCLRDGERRLEQHSGDDQPGDQPRTELGDCRAPLHRRLERAVAL